CESIKDIFDFAKMYEQIGVEELSLIDVKKTVGEAIALFSCSPNLRIINECNGLRVLADSFLRQLYYNLIDNSVRHGKRVTKIRVHYEKNAKNELNLIYEDDGVGVPVQNKPYLFNDGFSTSDSSGHGLFLIRKMMKVYGWSIEENGEPDVGAKFAITIPKLNNIGKENYEISK
ncbi:MAG TPA: HAMP domain-containing sensor histidine kinase, partial [Candidatus Acidoferrum sp.]|nr:HAMP domain-containing sensor histidine kinase [Candidatus Acidoferrum sp.]